MALTSNRSGAKIALPQANLMASLQLKRPTPLTLLRRQTLSSRSTAALVIQCLHKVCICSRALEFLH